MTRTTGTYRTTTVAGEQVRSFVPLPLPPKAPPLVFDDRLTQLLADATTAISRLAVAGAMVPSADWFLYGFVRKEAVITSLHMNIDFKPCVVTAMQEISRDGGQAKLLSPQFGFVSGEEISGRMTGFEKSLCPIA